jgi:hypothetical protein
MILWLFAYKSGAGQTMLLVLDDVLRSVAGCLTREEAGRLLAPLCRAGTEVVRAGDAADAAAADAAAAAAAADGAKKKAKSWKRFWQWELAPWAFWRSQPRIAARYPEGDSLPGLCMVLQSLNMQLYYLEQDRLIEMVFDRSAACAGQQASVLGCHTLRVLDGYEFLTTMQCWLARMRRKPEAAPSVWRYGSGSGRSNPHKAGTCFVRNLLKELGLHARRGTRFGRKHEVSPREVLWNREWVATSVWV